MYKLVIKEETLEKIRKDYISNLNDKFYKIRLKEFNKAVYKDCYFNGDDLIFEFVVYPTYGKGYEMVDIINLDGSVSKSRYYNVFICFVGIKKALLRKYVKYSRNEKLKFWAWAFHHWNDVRVHSNDPSFFYQGAWFRLDRKNISLYKFPSGYTDNGIWGSRHGKPLYITKHLMNVLDVFKFNLVEYVRDVDNLLSGKYNYLNKSGG